MFVEDEKGSGGSGWSVRLSIRNGSAEAVGSILLVRQGVAEGKCGDSSDSERQEGGKLLMVEDIVGEEKVTETALVPVDDYGVLPDVRTEEYRLLDAGIVQTYRERKAENTRRAHESRFRMFDEWTAARGVMSLPATPHTVRRYAQYMDNEGKALATIMAHVYAIAIVHKENGEENPCMAQGVRGFLSGKRRQHKGRMQKQAQALSDEGVMKILVWLDTPRKLRGGRMEDEYDVEERCRLERALLLTMIQGGLRRSEAQELQWGDVRFMEDGSGRVVVRFSKTDQTGQSAMVAVKSDCSRALRELRRFGVDEEEKVFGLNGNQIARRLKAMARSAGLDDGRISGHTPRVTLARIMSEHGAPTHAIQSQGRWNSAAMVSGYTREADAGENLKWL